MSASSAFEWTWSSIRESAVGFCEGKGAGCKADSRIWPWRGGYREEVFRLLPYRSRLISELLVFAYSELTWGLE